jgi:cyclophilin family peptidyl-prolyl cis-trans isomerase
MIPIRFFFVALLSLNLAIPSLQARPRKHARGLSSLGPESQVLVRIREIEAKRISKDKFLISALSHPSLRVRKAALLALGRIGDSSAMDEMANILNKKDDTLKSLTAFSLGLICGDIAPKLLQQVLTLNKKPEVLVPVLVALGRCGGEDTVSLLAGYVKDGVDLRIQEAASQGLGLLWSGSSEKWQTPPGLLSRLVVIARGAGQPSLTAAFTLSRYKGDPTTLPIAEIAEAIGKSELVYGRAFLVRALSKSKSTMAAQTLFQEMATSPYPTIKIEAAKGLALQTPSLAAMAALTQSLRDPHTNVVATILDTLAELSPPAPSLSSAVDAIRNVLDNSPSVWVQGEALKALAHLDPTAARPRIDKLLATPHSNLIPAATFAFGVIATPDDWDRVAGFVMSSTPRISEEAIESLGTKPEGLIPPSIKAALRKSLERADIGLTSMISELVEKTRWTDFLPTLTSVYPLLRNKEDAEAKQAVLSALAVVGDNSTVPLLQQAVNDPIRQVSLAASDAIKQITGTKPTADVPSNSRLDFTIPSDQDISRALKSKAVLVTTRGKIEIKFEDVAPLASANFVKLARRGFYDGLIFHRIVPNFVAQGGDPRGDGFGGPGYLIPDEVSPFRHSRGTLGMATAGKDTGGSQFFINLAPNPHLDGRYTVFAEITNGLEVADKLEVGDKIISVRVN